MSAHPAIIAPSLLSADFTQLGHQIAAVEAAGAEWIHLDVMDGRFVPPITFGDTICKAVRSATKLTIDAHLMIVEPERQIAAFAAAGANYLTIHTEACPHLHRNLQEIKAAGMKAGVTLNPATPVESLWNVLPEVDLVLVMSVNPGWGAQKYIQSATDKIQQLAEWREKYGFQYLIEVDGGISVDTIQTAYQAGADVFVAGTAVFKGDIAQNILALRGAIR